MRSVKSASWIASIAIAALALPACDDNKNDETRVERVPDAGVDAGPELFDPLSMPQTPTLAVELFNSADACKKCHVTHYEEWRTSMHAYAMVDPVYRALVLVRQRDLEGDEDRFCTQCHSAIGTRAGEFAKNFAFEDISPVTLEGVTCEACHKVSDVRRTHNSGHVLSQDGPMRATIRDPAPSGFHASQYSELHGTSEFCGACHDVVESSGLKLERPYLEWKTSPAAAEGRNCQSCHMPTYRGRAAEDAPERDLHRHTFVGVDLPLTEGFVDDAEMAQRSADIDALLATAADLGLAVPEGVSAGQQVDVVVTVRNRIDAHNLPTGSTFIRQLWIELEARDADDNLLYRTGDLDANGDLRDHWSALDAYGDHDLVKIGSNFLDARGNPTVFPWQAFEHRVSTLPPNHERTWTLFVPTSADTRGPIRVHARQRFRTHGPFLLRALGLERLVDKLVIRDIAEASAEVPIR